MDTNRSLIEEFSTSFTASRTDLSSRLDAFKSTGPKTQESLDQLALGIAKLRKELVNATIFLPAYDQRQYESQVKAFEQSLQQLRVATGPKPKFTFKRKQTTPSTGQLSTAPKESIMTETRAVLSAAASVGRVLSGRARVFLSLSSLPASSGFASELTISDIDYCVVDLIPRINARDTSSYGSADAPQSLTALHVKNVKNSILVLPIMSGSAILHDVQNSIIVIGCHQFRMHSSSHVNVYLSIPSNPIIEHCSDIKFTSYPACFLTAFNGVDQTSNNHLSVKDFSHIRASPSPNWRPLSDEETIVEEDWPSVPLADDTEAILQRLLPSV